MKKIAILGSTGSIGLNSLRVIEKNPDKYRAVALAAGKNQFEKLDEGRFRYAGRIRLASQCLKCHVKHRTSTEDRAAGLLITMPLRFAEVSR